MNNKPPRKQPAPGAFLSGATEPAQKPPAQPPRIHYQGMTRTYKDLPGFGYDILQVTVGDTLFELYRACSFAENGGVTVMVIPLQNGAVFTTLAEADAYKEQIKAQALKPKLVIPGQPDFKPPILH